MGLSDALSRRDAGASGPPIDAERARPEAANEAARNAIPQEFPFRSLPTADCVTAVVSVSSRLCARKG